ncbi:ATP-grasp domain-containing protein [Paramagnetospirillum kuznetsovii]|nr:hypothetical protein [Paramagnetospirillum kuznetsovii]
MGDKHFAFVTNDGEESTGRHWPQLSYGMAKLTGMAFRGENMMPLALELNARIDADASDTAAMMDLATIHILWGQEERAKLYQSHAFCQQRIYRDPCHRDTSIRLLALAAPGNLMANSPIQFLLEDSDICLDILYIVPGTVFPEITPDHDVVMVIVGESDDSHEILECISGSTDRWPCPINDPRSVLNLSRDSVSSLLAEAPGIFIPSTIRAVPPELMQLGLGQVALSEVLPGAKFPIIVRPLDSHAGIGLEKLDEPAAIASYLLAHPADEYYLSSFIDYRSQGGMFRKYRIVVIDGCPYVCHMAVSSNWMVHYLNAGMYESAEKRDEEAKAFTTFDSDFAKRHAVAFKALVDCLNLDYFAIDCAETTDGRLFIFEVGTAMIVHAMDPEDVFPYKRPQMQRIFHAFQEMLHRRVMGATTPNRGRIQVP